MCGLDVCSNKYTTVSGYKTHLYRKHRQFLQLDEADCEERRHEMSEYEDNGHGNTG